MLLAGRREGLVGALQDPLRPDVDPRARPSSGRTSSNPPPRVAGTRPTSPTSGRAASSRSGRAATAESCETLQPACRTERGASRRQRAAEAHERSPSARRASGPPCRCRRRRRAPRAARPLRHRDCSAACAAELRSPTNARSARCRAVRGSCDRSPHERLDQLVDASGADGQSSSSFCTSRCSFALATCSASGRRSKATQRRRRRPRSRPPSRSRIR